MPRLRLMLVFCAAYAFPGAEARADCFPPGVDFHPPPEPVRAFSAIGHLGPDPTLFAFWPGDRTSEFEVVCETTGASLIRDVVPEPGPPGFSVARIRVQTGDCSRIALHSPSWDDPRGPQRYDLEAPSIPAGPRLRPAIVAAKRQNVQFGCGPSNHLDFELDVTPAAVAVELEPEADRFVLPVWPAYDDDSDHGSFWLGKQMCTGPNFDLDRLDAPIRIRVAALYPDGSIDQGVWQTIAPPPTDDLGHDEAAYIVEPVAAEYVRPPADPAVPEATEVAPLPTEIPHGPSAWWWLLLIPAVGASVAWMRRSGSRPVHPPAAKP